MNKSDSEIMAGLLDEEGFKRTTSPETADVIILNTCNVKKPTEHKMLHRAHKLSSLEKPLIIAGCMAKSQTDSLRSYASALIGPKSIGKIVEVVRLVLGGGDGIELIRGGSIQKALLPRVSHSRVSAIIPIEEGCLGNCTYCITRFARGTLQSYPPDDVMLALRKAVARGFKEVFLTGQDLGVYGWDIGTDLADLLRRLPRLSGAFRVRVGMLNPAGVTEFLGKLLDSFSDQRVYKFFHVPVQSGSDRLLLLMLRRYSSEQFERMVQSMRQRYPLSTVATDVIVGFPTETEEDFEATIGLIERTKPEVINLSKFGVRPGTRAASMPKLPSSTIRRRSKIMSRVCVEVKKKRNEELVGREFTVLITERLKKGFQGRTDFYRPVAIAEEVELGDFYEVEITEARSNYLVGTVLSKIGTKGCERGHGQ